jgi:ribosomal protein S18 acetylase RimI-like enzyme
MIMQAPFAIKTLQIDNLMLRPAKMEDLPAAVALFNACSLEQVGACEFSLKDVRTEWMSPGFNLATDTRIILTEEGAAVGFMEIWDVDPHVRLYAWGRVHPDFRGRGLGTRLLWWAETRARQAVPKAPSGARVSLLSSTISTDKAGLRLYANRGFKLTRHFLRMEISFAAPPLEPLWPEGLTVRALLPGEEGAVLHADRDVFKDHWGHVERPFEVDYQRLVHFIENDSEFDPELWFLALDRDQIAGFSLCSPSAAGHPDTGWVNALGVRRPWRRRGLALALLQHSFVAFYRRGLRKAGLGVDAQSLTGATRLYEKAGMQSVRQTDTYEKVLRPGENLTTQVVSSHTR